ncbi:hypothetical protein HHI36_001358 [Cryptolaemus montrouzieri]|uniref:Uncharacterized protein n=1 Tax=Cryptolaemus montrouzieri TaxID=559131 RepID=A0ABD2P7L8_9CUCU
MISLQSTKLGRNGHANIVHPPDASRGANYHAVQDLQTAESQICSLSTEVSEIKVSISDVQNQATILSTDVASLQTSTNHIDAIEILDRIRRSHNIIIRYVPDKQDSESGDLSVRAIVDFLSPGSSQHIVATSRLVDAEKRMPRRCVCLRE